MVLKGTKKGKETQATLKSDINSQNTWDIQPGPKSIKTLKSLMRPSTSPSGFLHSKSALVPVQAEPLVLPSWKLQVQHWPQFLEVMVVSDKKNIDLLWTCFSGRSTWVVADIAFYCQNHLPPTIETYWNNGKMILGLSSIMEIMMCHDHPWPWYGWHISRTNVLHRPCSKNWWFLAVVNRSYLYLPESRATCYCNLT